jgi:hypothetical protein
MPCALATTPFWGGRVVLAVPLPPSSLGHPGAARSILEECLMRYHSVLRGFLVAFSGARFSSAGRYGSADGTALGRIVAEQPVVHAHLEAQVLLFRPVCGQVLEGVVNRVSPHHISCLVAGMFNASILVDDMGGGYSFVEGGAGAWRSTAVRQRACELEAAAGSGGGGSGGGGSGGGRSSGSSSSSSSSSGSGGGGSHARGDAGRNELLASNPDAVEVGSTIFFRVRVMLHSNGVLNMKGEFSAAPSPRSGAL